jgi:hypothetical protein
LTSVRSVQSAARTLVRASVSLRSLPASRFLPSDYPAATLPLAFQVRACHEPLWPSSPTQGGPWVRQWAIICHIYLPCPTSATTGR